jgi:hypothetical protein
VQDARKSNVSASPFGPELYASFVTLDFFDEMPPSMLDNATAVRRTYEVANTPLFSKLKYMSLNSFDENPPSNMDNAGPAALRPSDPPQEIDMGLFTKIVRTTLGDDIANRTLEQYDPTLEEPFRAPAHGKDAPASAEIKNPCLDWAIAFEESHTQYAIQDKANGSLRYQAQFEAWRSGTGGPPVRTPLGDFRKETDAYHYACARKAVGSFGLPLEWAFREHPTPPFERTRYSLDEKNRLDEEERDRKAREERQLAQHAEIEKQRDRPQKPAFGIAIKDELLAASEFCNHPTLKQEGKFLCTERRGGEHIYGFVDGPPEGLSFPLEPGMRVLDSHETVGARLPLHVIKVNTHILTYILRNSTKTGAMPGWRDISYREFKERHDDNEIRDLFYNGANRQYSQLTPLAIEREERGQGLRPDVGVVYWFRRFNEYHEKVATKVRVQKFEEDGPEEKSVVFPGTLYRKPGKQIFGDHYELPPLPMGCVSRDDLAAWSLQYARQGIIAPFSLVSEVEADSIPDPADPWTESLLHFADLMGQFSSEDIVAVLQREGFADADNGTRCHRRINSILRPHNWSKAYVTRPDGVRERVFQKGAPPT